MCMLIVYAYCGCIADVYVWKCNTAVIHASKKGYEREGKRAALEREVRRWARAYTAILGMNWVVDTVIWLNFSDLGIIQSRKDFAEIWGENS